MKTMNKRTNLMTATLISVGSVAQIPQKPNIIWIMAEDMGQDLECYGMKAVRTLILTRWQVKEFYISQHVVQLQ